MSIKTIFEKIIDREIPSNILYEDDKYICIHDINPKKKIHLLIITKRLIKSFVDAGDNANDQELIKWMMDIAWIIIKKYKISWCNLLFNSGIDHGQEVPHIHLHLMSDDDIKII